MILKLFWNVISMRPMYIRIYARMLESQSIMCHHDIYSLAIADIRCNNANNSARGVMMKYIDQSCRQRRRDFIRFE